MHGVLSYHPVFMPPVRIDVPTPSPYAVTIEDGSLTVGGCSTSSRFRRRFAVSSPAVWRLHGARVARDARRGAVLIPDGERFKQLATVAR
jgi:hypothetical protein